MYPEPQASTCLFCGGECASKVAYPGEQHDGPIACRSIAICATCGGGTALPRPTQEALDRYYESGAYWHATGGQAQRAHSASQAWMRVARLRPLLPGGTRLKVADIGAGHGGIAMALEGQAIPVARYEYVELDAAASSTVGALPLPFAVVSRPRIADLGRDLDLVFLNHVVEHVAEPVSFLETVLQHLAPGALAYVETPHADHRFKADVFPHLSFFTPESMLRIGDRLGVRTLACETFGHWLSPRATPRGFVQRVAARGLAACAPLGWDKLDRALDRAIWGYGPDASGIWLRWILRARGRGTSLDEAGLRNQGPLHRAEPF